MDEKKAYDIVIESERQEKLRKFNLEYEGTFDDTTFKKIRLSYNIQDGKTVLRLMNLKLIFEQIKHVNMTIDELIIFLKSAMNYDEMQIWLVKQQMKGVQLSLNEKLRKFFELKSDADILKQYDVE